MTKNENDTITDTGHTKININNITNKKKKCPILIE